MNHIKVELDFIPVEERLPENGIERDYRFIRYLLRLSKHPYYAMAIHDKGRFYTLFGERLEEAVTHWAEIPKIGG